MNRRSVGIPLALMACAAFIVASACGPPEVSRRPEKRRVLTPPPAKSLPPSPPPSVATDGGATGPLSIRLLTVGGSSKAASGLHRTSAIAPKDGSLILLWVATYGGRGDAPVPRVSGAGLRWEVLATDPPEGARGAPRRLTLLWGIGPSSSTAPLTIVGGATSNWSVVQVSTKGARSDAPPEVSAVSQITRSGWETTKTFSFPSKAKGYIAVAGFLFGRAEVPQPEPGTELLGYNSVVSPRATLAITHSVATREGLGISWSSPGHSRAIAVQVTA